MSLEPVRRPVSEKNNVSQKGGSEGGMEGGKEAECVSHRVSVSPERTVFSVSSD